MSSLLDIGFLFFIILIIICIFSKGYLRYFVIIVTAIYYLVGSGVIGNILATPIRS
ncbi:YdcF family protein, partial [Francisella philomiragia]